MKITESRLRKIIKRCFLQEFSSFFDKSYQLSSAGMRVSDSISTDTGDIMSSALMVTAEAEDELDEEDLIDEDEEEESSR